MTTAFFMPARGEDAAPIFNELRPRELSRFFDELEYLFKRAAITSEADKKNYTLRYVDFDIEEFDDPTKTYAEFKAGILDRYPEASEENRYCFSDIDILIDKRLQLGINSVKDLADFTMRFLAITNWLIDKGQLRDLEQQRTYIRVFPSSLLPSILTRLQIKFFDHHPRIPYKVSDVYEAALFVLRCASPSVYRNQYSLSDMDALIGERLRLGIYCVNDLADFHTQFLATTKWLIDRQQLCDLEQRRSYIRAFPPSILTRLQIKLPNHHPHIPHKVSDIYEAALFVLRSAEA